MIRILVLAGLFAAGAGPMAHALEQPQAFTEDDLRIGAPLTPDELAEAKQFCQDTLASAALPPTEAARTCACFPREWESRTNRLHRLILPIVKDANAPESRRNLALIERAQGGVKDDRLKQLSVEYQAAARQAIKACR